MVIDLKSWRGLLVSAAIVLALVWLSLTPGQLQHGLANENGPIELFAEGALLVALLVSVYGAVTLRGALRWYLVLWSVLCFLFFGEETSWLQDFIHYPTPAWMANDNVQHEFNLHNLEPFHGGELVGNQFDWHALLSSEALFFIGFVAYFLLMPLLALAAPLRGLIERLGVPYPGKRLVVCIFVPFAVSAVLTLLATDPIAKGAMAESRETIAELAILVFVVLTVRAGTRAQR